jgi:hypothetical protein
VKGKDRSGDDGPAAEHVLALWTPGQEAAPTEPGVAFRIPSGGELQVQIRYKKTWLDEQNELKDRSRVGLYFADGPTTEIQALRLRPEPEGTDRKQVTMTHLLDQEMELLALYAEPSWGEAELRLGVIAPQGRPLVLARVNLHPGWTRRYWLEKPLRLSSGSRLQVTVTSLTDVPLATGDAAAVALNVVPGSALHTSR